MKRLGLLFFLLVSHGAIASWQAALPDAQVVGAGDLRVFGFRVYTARLLSAGKPLNADQPFALELTYHRTISRDDLVQASVDEIKRTSPTPVTDQQLVAWRAQMARAFVDVQEGMKITGVYIPGREARFYVGEKLQHVVQDPQFAKAFFDIWLSPKTRNPELREQLLGVGN
jgi:hypothetical protein